MTETTRLFHCPACGAPLEPSSNQTVIQCTFCKSSIVIDGAIRSADQKRLPGNEFMNEVVLALTQGDKVQAIRIFRENTHAGLAEAKNIVDSIERGEALDITRFLTSDKRDGQSLGRLDASGRIPPLKTPVESSLIQTGKIQPIVTDADPRKRNPRIFAVAAATLVILGILVAVLLTSRSPSPESGVIATVQELILPTPTPSFATALLVLNNEGSGAGMLNDPRAIAVDREGNIIVGDYSDGRIQVFDPDGKFQTLINLGKEVAVFNIAAAPDGTFYACYRGEIHHFDPSGKDLGQIIFPMEEDYGWFENIAMGADGRLYVVTTGETILRYDQNGEVNLTIPNVFSAVTDHPELDMKLAVDGLGNIYILGTFNNLVLKYDADGRYLDQFGGDTRNPAGGVDPGHFQAPDAIAVDGYGRIFVSDVWGIQVFDSNGQTLDFFEIDGTAFGMTFDLNNDLYIASNKPAIIKFQLTRP